MVEFFLSFYLQINIVRYLFVSGDRNCRPGHFHRSVKESLNGPVQANRSDDIKNGSGIERKNKPRIKSAYKVYKVHKMHRPAFFPDHLKSPNKCLKAISG